MLLRRVFTKILEGGNPPMKLLHLVKNDQSLSRYYFLSSYGTDLKQNPLYLIVLFKQILHLSVVVTIDVCDMLVVCVAEMLENVCFSDLTRTKQDKRLPIRGFLPYN